MEYYRAIRTNELHLTCKNMDESYKHNIKQKNPEIKEFMILFISSTNDVKLIYGVRIQHSTSDSRVEGLVTGRGTR